MATKYGLNFRQTSGYVTDGTDETYSIGGAYPQGPRIGLTFGWYGADGVTPGPVPTFDSSSVVDVRVAGYNSVANTSQRYFRVGLPDGPGEYDVWLAVGDGVYRAVAAIHDSDGSGNLGAQLALAVDDSPGTGAWRLYDADETNFTGADFAATAAAWVAGQAPVRLTVTGTALWVRIGANGVGSTTGATHLRHLAFQKVEVADTTAPTRLSAAVAPDGLSVAITFDEDVVLNDGDATGFTIQVNGVTRSTTGASAAGAVVTIPVSSVIYDTDTVTDAYQNFTGNVRDTAATPNQLATYTAQSTTNSSTQTAGGVTTGDETYALTATVYSGASGTGSVLTGRIKTYASTDEAVATVDSSGVVTRVALGTCDITATCEGVTSNVCTVVVETAP